MIEFVDQNVIWDFRDRFGQIRTIGGCSVAGKIEFDQRIKKIYEILDDSHPNKSIGAIYREDDVFRYCCDRALLLNGIDPDWVNDPLLVALLFTYNGKQGALVQLNTLQGTTAANASDTPATLAQIMAAIASFTDPATATRLAKEGNWKELMSMMQEINKQAKEKQENLGNKNPNNSKTESKEQTNSSSQKKNKPTPEEIDLMRIRTAKIRKKTEKIKLP